MPSTSTISIAAAGQSRTHTLQFEPTMDLTSKVKPPEPVPMSMTLQDSIVYTVLQRASSGSTGFTKGYFVVAGFVNMCDAARLNIGDMRDFFFSVICLHQRINPCY